MAYFTLEERLYSYAENWPEKRIEIIPSEVVELLDEKDLKIKILENRIIELNRQLQMVQG